MWSSTFYSQSNQIAHRVYIPPLKFTFHWVTHCGRIGLGFYRLQESCITTKSCIQYQQPIILNVFYVFNDFLFTNLKCPDLFVTRCIYIYILIILTQIVVSWVQGRTGHYFNVEISAWAAPFSGFGGPIGPFESIKRAPLGAKRASLALRDPMGFRLQI